MMAATSRPAAAPPGATAGSTSLPSPVRDPQPGAGHATAMGEVEGVLCPLHCAFDDDDADNTDFDSSNARCGEASHTGRDEGEQDDACPTANPPTTMALFPAVGLSRSHSTAGGGGPLGSSGHNPLDRSFPTSIQSTESERLRSVSYDYPREGRGTELPLPPAVLFTVVPDLHEAERRQKLWDEMGMAHMMQLMEEKEVEEKASGRQEVLTPL